MRSREEMLAYIQERLERAGDPEIEEFFWFAVLEEENRQNMTNIACGQ